MVLLVVATDSGFRNSSERMKRVQPLRKLLDQSSVCPAMIFLKRARGVGVDQAHEPPLEILCYVGRHAVHAVEVHLVAGAVRGCPSGVYAMAGD
jgi:hypothetical protein